MLRYFVLSLYLVAFTWQAIGEEEPTELPELWDDDYELSELNDTDISIAPQARFVQLQTTKKTFAFNFLPVNWHTARELCTAQNQVLASIESARENYEIVDALSKYGIFYTGATFWIGGSELGHIGQWTWVSTGQPIGYMNFQSNPDNNYWNRHCIEIVHGGVWNFNDCDLKRPVICQDLPACN